MLMLQVPSWHNYRDKQRQYLRKREQERVQQRNQANRMAHATRLINAPIRVENNHINARMAGPSVNDGGYNHKALKDRPPDSDVMMYMKRLSTDVAAGLTSYRITQQEGKTPMHAVRGRSLSTSRVTPREKPRVRERPCSCHSLTSTLSSSI